LASQARAGGAGGLDGLAGDGRDPMMTGTAPVRARRRARPGLARGRGGSGRLPGGGCGAQAACLQRGLAVAFGRIRVGPSSGSPAPALLQPAEPWLPP